MIELSIVNDNLDYTTDIELEGTEYKYRIYWHELYDRWYIDLLSSSGSNLVVGKKLVVGSPLFRYRKLAGDIVAVSKTSDTSPPGIKHLSDRIKLFYLNSQEIDKSIKTRNSFGLSDFMNLLI